MAEISATSLKRKRFFAGWGAEGEAHVLSANQDALSAWPYTSPVKCRQMGAEPCYFLAQQLHRQVSYDGRWAQSARSTIRRQASLAVPWHGDT